MKTLKIKITVAALTAMMAVSATACTIDFKNSKQLESAIDSLSDKVHVVIDENGDQAQADGTVMDGSRDTDPNEAVAPSETLAPAVETKPVETIPTQIETQAPTEKKETQAPKQTQAPKETEAPKQTQAPTEAPKETEAPAETQPQATEPQIQETEAPETEAPETTPSETQPEIQINYNDPLAPRWAYKDIIDPDLDVYGKVIKYSLMHLDGDEIPELVIYDKTNYDNGGELTVYTYRNDKAVLVLDHVYSGQGVYYTYAPYKNTICKNVAYNDVSAIQTIYTVDQLINNQEGSAFDGEFPPVWPIEGYTDGFAINDYFRSCWIPSDQEFFDMSKPYEPEYYEVTDYSKYAGTYKNEDDTFYFTICEPDWRNEVQISMWVYRTAELAQVKVPINGNVAVFYYKGYEDRNFNGRCDAGERFYRKGTIELLQYGVRLTIEECDASDIVPMLDVTNEFAGCQFIREQTVFFSLQYKY